MDSKLRLETKIKQADINNYYGTPFRYWIGKYLPILIKNNCPDTNAKILDIGCGQGHYANVIKKLSIKGEYLGIDLEQKENWEKMLSDNGLKIRFKKYDAEKLSTFNTKYNFLFGITSFEHFKDQIAVILGAYNVTEENGKILIIIPSHYSYFNYGTHGFRRYSKQSLFDLVNEARYEDISVGKIGGFFSYIFHFFWRNITRFIQIGIKIIIFSLFGWNKQKAYKVLPGILTFSNDLMHIHLTTRIGKLFHKLLIVTAHKLDRWAPFLEIGYYCTARKK